MSGFNVSNKAISIKSPEQIFTPGNKLITVKRDFLN